jgi:hypothetical protein
VFRGEEILKQRVAFHLMIFTAVLNYVKTEIGTGPPSGYIWIVPGIAVDILTFRDLGG